MISDTSEVWVVQLNNGTICGIFRYKGDAKEFQERIGLKTQLTCYPVRNYVGEIQ